MKERETLRKKRTRKSEIGKMLGSEKIKTPWKWKEESESCRVAEEKCCGVAVVTI